MVIGCGVGEVRGSEHYSSYVLCGIDGSVGVHRKTRCQTPRCPIRLGERAEAHDLLGSRVGVLICAETRFPEAAQEIAAAGAQLLLMPHAYGVGGPGWVPFETAVAQTVAARCREASLPGIVIGNTGAGLQGGIAVVSGAGEVIEQRMDDRETLHWLTVAGTCRSV